MAQENLIKKVKSFIEGEDVGGFNGSFVKACIDSYIFEYFFYAGAPKGGDRDPGLIMPRLNLWLKNAKPDWAMSGSGPEATVKQLDPEAYKKMMVRMWKLHNEKDYAQNLTDQVMRLWDDWGADGNEGARVLSENEQEILFQTENQFGNAQPDTTGYIKNSPKPNYLFWPGKDSSTSLLEGSTPSNSAKTNLYPRDMLTFLQVYRSSGIMSLGAGDTTYLRINPRKYNKKGYHIRINETFGRGVRFIPIMFPKDDGWWVIDQSANSHLSYYKDTLKFPTYTGPEMKAMYEEWKEKKSESSFTWPGYDKPTVRQVDSISADFPNIGFGGGPGSQWKSGVVWLGFPDTRDSLGDVTYPIDVNWYDPRGTPAQQYAYFNMRVVAAISSCYPGEMINQMKEVLGDVLEGLDKDEKTAAKIIGGPVDSIFVKEGVNPNTAALKPYNDQCFLLENIRPLSSWRNDAATGGSLGYTNLGIIGAQYKAPGNLISYLNHGNKTDEANALLNLCPDVYALLTPYMKIYRVDYKKDKTLVPYKETEIPFPTFIDPTDIEAMTGTNYGRFPGAGIQSFSWNLDGVNPAEVENNISANLVLHFQTVQDFFSLNTSLKAGAKEAGYLDLVIGSGTSFQDKPTKPVKGTTAKKSTSSACLEAATSKYEGERFRIKIVAGWSTPPGFANIVDEMDAARGKNPGYGTALQKAIDRTRVALYLQNTTHELTFNEDGSVGLNIDYQASLSGILRAPNADIFTGGTEYEQKIEELEESLEKQNKEIKTYTTKKPGITSEDEQLQAMSSKKQKTLEELTSLIKKEKSLKYKRFLCSLYTSGKIYSLKIPRNQFSLLKDLTPAQRAKESQRRIANSSLYKAGFEPQNPTNADLDQMNEMASYMVDQGDATTDSAQFIQNLRDNQFAKSLKDMSGNDVEIPYFYLGDFIDGILGYLQNIVTQKGDKIGSFQLLLGQIELLDPHLAFQIKQVDIKCGNAKDAIISRAMADINPLKFRGLNNIKFSTSLASLPISLEFFQEWFINNVVRSQRETYPFLQFLKAVCSGLISHAFNSACFDDALKFNLRFDTSIFNFDKNYTGRFPSVVDLATSKTNADDISREQLSPRTKTLIPSIVLYSVDSQPTSEGDYSHDLANGIYHYYLGASCGIAKKIQFQRQNMPYYREARIGRTSALSAVQLREMYNAQVEMVGNNLHRNGQYMFINPIAIGAGAAAPRSGDLPTFAQLLGIGGYYLISKVSHEISAGGFNVSVTAIQEGQSFSSEGNGIVSATNFDQRALATTSITANQSSTVTSAAFALGYQPNAAAATNLSSDDPGSKEEVVDFSEEEAVYYETLDARVDQLAAAAGDPEREADIDYYEQAIAQLAAEGIVEPGE